jgi:hypothetical protein
MNGLRVWNLDAYGRLRAYLQTTAPPWRPGVNVAGCFREPAFSVQGVVDPERLGRRAINVQTERVLGGPEQTFYVEWSTGERGVYRSIQFEAQAPPAKDHTAPGEKCTCGFSANTDPAAPFLSAPINAEGLVLGVIKGSGRIITPRPEEFRCEKAEIIALLKPGTPRAAKMLSRVYPDVPQLPNQKALLAFAPVAPTIPDPSTDEFWALP